MSEENKPAESKYKCSECGKAVIVYNGEVHRICEHKESAVIAECSATCYGDSCMIDG